MKLVIQNVKDNPTTLLRRAGYVFQRHDGNEMSFIRPLAQSGFPRFHIYASSKNNELILNVHLDQKKGTYGRATRHHGEYGEESEVLAKEVEYLKTVIG